MGGLDLYLATCARLPRLDADDQGLLAALQARRLRVEPAVWDDPQVEWGAARAVLVRSTWDYERRRAEFLGWAERVPVPLWNPPQVLRWNTHKRYLMEMAADGLPVVPTRLLAPGDEAGLEAALSDWPDAVLKPAVGAGARGAFLARRDGLEATRAHGRALLAAGEDVLVQPYRQAVEREGELSLLWFAGQLSHAVQKRPARGEWRIQEVWGGTRHPIEAPPGTPELAARFLAWAQARERAAEALLYARVDLLPGPAGWELGELELTEPSLYLREGGVGAAGRLADAIAARLTR